MSEPTDVSSGTLNIQRACPECEEELQSQPIEEEKELQARAISGHISNVNPDLKSQIQSIRRGVQPLSENDRAYFEPRFGRDFSQVRVHTDEKAARAVNARAFMINQDLVIGSNINF